MSTFTLGKEERLKSKKQIDYIFQNGKSIKAFPLMLVYAPAIKRQDYDEKKSFLFGASVSKRKFKKAVDRNKIKRLIREAFRLNCIETKQKLFKKELQFSGMFIYISKELLPYHQIEISIVKILQHLEQSIKK